MRPATTRSAGPKGRPTEDVARRKLAKVLSVASGQFSDLGYRAVTMRGVAEKARVSTRTLYNRYSNKLSLFKACLEFAGQAFPVPDPSPGEDPEQVLQRYAAAIVRALSLDSRLRLSLLVYREGTEFPEILIAAEAQEDRLLIRPLAAYLRQVGLESTDSDERARLFLAMALAQLNRRRRSLQPPSGDEVVRYAALVARTVDNPCRTVEQLHHMLRTGPERLANRLRRRVRPLRRERTCRPTK